MSSMEFTNLSQLFLHAACADSQNGIIYYPLGGLGAGQQRFTSYRDMLARVTIKASLLANLKLAAASIVLLQFDEHQPSIEWFWAVTLAGYTPAISPPLSRDDRHREAHLAHLDQLLDKPLCLTTRKILPQFADKCTIEVMTIEELEEKNERSYASFAGVHKLGSDPASLMLTSGSSGKPKAVILPHSMILGALAGKHRMLESSSETPFLSWIGMDHVANLTEIHLHAMFVGANQVMVQAIDLIPNPLAFLSIIQKNKVAYTFAPNFFLASLRDSLLAHQDQAEGLDLQLNSLKAIVSGGEANVVEVCANLATLLEQYGAPANVLTPAFGMTETAAGCIYNKLFPKYDLQRRSEFANVGRPISGFEIRISSDDGDVEPRDVVGHLQVRGKNVFTAYHNNSSATEESFTSDGWFKTGDNGYIDSEGMLHLVGRSKDTVIINGVNYSPAETESLLSEVEGAVATYTVVVPYRPKGAPTEELCVVYLPSYEADDAKSRSETNSMLSKLVMLHTGVRPLVIPLDARKLQKTSLGKLSRAQIAKALVNGEYAEYIALNDEQVALFQKQNFRVPSGEYEELVARVLAVSSDFSGTQIGADQNIFALGINSIELFRIKARLERELGSEIPLLTVMSNPSIQSLATALEGLKHKRDYDPLVVLQSEGSKTPLWLVHPGVGEILVFLPLASYMTDRPIYALRARGFESGEKHFQTWQEARDTYLEKIKAVQPHGPYAIAGYSYGSMIAFEMGKILEASGDQVKFLGVFNLPPHIKTRMRQLDWTNCILNLGYFLSFFSEEYALEMHPILREKTQDEVLDWVMQVSPPERVIEVDLNREKLFKWANLAFALQNSATNYEPSGKISCMDIFCAIPLASVANGIHDWRDNHLKKWADYAAETPRTHDVNGAHYTMLSPANVGSFQKTLKAALAQRGL